MNNLVWHLGRMLAAAQLLPRFRLLSFVCIVFLTVQTITKSATISIVIVTMIVMAVSVVGRAPTLRSCLRRAT